VICGLSKEGGKTLGDERKKKRRKKKKEIKKEERKKEEERGEKEENKKKKKKTWEEEGWMERGCGEGGYPLQEDFTGRLLHVSSALLERVGPFGKTKQIGDIGEVGNM